MPNSITTIIINSFKINVNLFYICLTNAFEFSFVLCSWIKQNKWRQDSIVFFLLFHYQSRMYGMRFFCTSAFQDQNNYSQTKTTTKNPNKWR